jgi:hypothetical protein
MLNQADEVFLLREEELTPLPTRSMRAGLFGKTLEDAIQTLLQKYPKIIPGKQIDPVSEDPPRFALLRREMPIGGWSLDHLYVDQKGILTLVETKLIQNPGARREVIGQIIEYAANANEFWASGGARRYATEFWSKQNRELDLVLQEQLGEDVDIEELWSNVEVNLRVGRIRLIIAADEIYPEVRRMIEYLNREMQNVEVLGLELRCYGESESSLVLVPRLLGQTQDAIDRKISGQGAILWNVEVLRAAYRDLPSEELGQRLLEVLDWALGSKLFLVARTKFPTFALQGNNECRLVSFFSDGTIYVFINEKHFVGGVAERDRFVGDLKALGLLDQTLAPSEVVSGRNLLMRLAELGDDDLGKLLNLFQQYCSSQ